MTNSIANGNVFEWTNGTGSAVASGGVVSLGGGLIGVLVTTVADGDTGAANVRGVYELAQAGFDGLQGQPVYWDTVAKELVQFPLADTDVAAGVLYKDCASGDATAQVSLNMGGVNGVAAANANVATADGSDPATTQALANALKVSFNLLQDKMRDAGLLAHA